VEELDMREVLTSEFENDPIYRLALLNKLEDSIFTESILSLHKDTTYSTVETGKIIDRSDSTIRNHFRSELVDYIAPEKFGKFYRLDYKSVFRLQLIFLLMDKVGKTTIDILAELGVQPGISITGNFKKIPHRNEIKNFQNENSENYDIVPVDTKLLEFENKLDMQGIMINILKYEKDISDIERLISNTQSSINKILVRSRMKFEKEISEIEKGIANNQSKISEAQSQSKMKFLEERQSLLITNSLKNSLKKSSFLGFLKKNDDVNVHQLATEIDDNLKGKYDNEFQEKIKEYNSTIETLNTKKKYLESKLVGLRNQFDSSTLNNELDTEVQEEIKEYIAKIEELQQKKKSLESNLQKENERFNLIQSNKNEVSTLNSP
jgi:predicted  nucleic acid-binding Zn-ribbon protein